MKKDKILHYIKEIISDKRKLIAFVLYIALLMFCFLTFQHVDLFHTSSSSYAYLKGHFIDFYDYNKKVIGGNDYYALMYIIFAIWNIPLKIFGLMHNTANGLVLSPIELFWTKMLLVVFFFATVKVIYNIAKLILNEKSNKAKWIAAIFATSPIAIFAVFIFGQYDIIGLFFTMVGLYYYLKKDYLKFSIAFSLAISLKFFPIMIFIPLILLAHKKIVNIIKYGIIGILATIIQIAMYLNNEAFRQGFVSLATIKVNLLQTWNISYLNNSPYLVIGYCIICIYAYIKEPKDDNDKNRISIFLCLISYSLFFSTFVWHPQWLIILMPFFALAYIYIEDTEKMYLFDIVGMFAFIYVVVNIFANNVDVIMVKSGILGRFVGYIPLINKSLFFPKYVYIFEGVFFVYLFSPILAYYFNKDRKQENKFNSSKNYFYARLYLGVGFFVVSSMVCIFAPKSIAQKISSNAYVTVGTAIEAADEVVPITIDSQVLQSFVGEDNYLKRIDIRFGTNARINTCDVNLTIYDENMNSIATETIKGESIVDNNFYRFKFTPIKNSKGNKYYIKISSDGNSKNSISNWVSKEDVYKEGQCFVNEKLLNGDLNMKLLYDMMEK